MLQSTTSYPASSSRPLDEGYRIPTAPRPAARRWISAGETVSVFGIQIPGPFYVGSTDASNTGGMEPSMIDPVLPVAAAGESYSPSRALWISYNATLNQQERRGYLLWMAGGRQREEIDVRFLFMYFHGLERRAVLDVAADPAARESLPEIVAELRRLSDVYGHRETSLKNAIFCLLYWIEHPGSPIRLYSGKDAQFHRFSGVRTYTQVAVGQCIDDRVPLTSRIALSWLINEGRAYLREPVLSHRKQFEALFDDFYGKMFGAGIVLPGVAARLKVPYRPASPALMNHPALMRQLADVADPDEVKTSLDAVKSVFDVAAEEITRYAKILVRRPETLGSLEVLSQLPMRLWPTSTKDALRALITQAASEQPLMTVRTLLAAIDPQAPTSKGSALLATSILLGVGLVTEPALLDGNRALKAEAAVMLLPEGGATLPAGLEEACEHAARCIEVACAILAVDGVVPMPALAGIEAQLAAWPVEELRAFPRLLARCRLSAGAAPAPGAVKKLVEAASPEQRRDIAAFVVRAAAAAREPTPAEVKLIGKLYGSCGLDAATVAADLHAAASGSVKLTSPHFSLDAARVSALTSESQRVSALLAEIFVQSDADELPPATAAPVANTSAAPADGGIAGLDASHEKFARALVSKASWSRAELETVAQGFDLMLGAALERINDLCLDVHDQLLVEGDDPIDLDADLSAQLGWA